MEILDPGRGVMPPLPSPVYAEKSILLASGSPRRRELLHLIVPEFDTAEPRDIDESYPSDLAPEEVPVYLSGLKASAYRDELHPDELLITADTVVILGDRILGKPHSMEEARRMLRSLCGRTHTVVTGVTLTSLEGKKRDTFAEHTKVTFAALSDSEIDAYVGRYRPLDKAGAYGIQEWFGAAGIRCIEGCFYNVMGLPLRALYEHLRHFFEQ